MSQPKKRLPTLKEKINIIEVYIEQKVGVRVPANTFQIGKTDGKPFSRMGEFLQMWNSNWNVTQKRSFFKTEGFNIDKLIYEWFVKARNKTIPL